MLEHNAQLQLLFHHEHQHTKKLRAATESLRQELEELREYKKRSLQTESLLTCSAALQGQRKLNNLFQVVVRQLCHLLNADRATLFLVDEDTVGFLRLMGLPDSTSARGMESIRHFLLLSHLSTLDRASKKPQHFYSLPKYVLSLTQQGELWSHFAEGVKSIRLPAGTGLVGYTASTGETLNIDDVQADSRFSQELDLRTGYRTRNILCMAIRNEGEIIGAVQVSVISSCIALNCPRRSITTDPHSSLHFRL